MRLREENRLKEKVELQLDMFYVVLWSIVLSGIIFSTGLFVGQKKQEGVNGFAMDKALELKQKDDAASPHDPLAASFSFISTLSKHPEKRELKDAVLNAMAKLRLETLEKVRAQEEEMRKELAQKLFKDRLAKADQAVADEDAEALGDPETLLARGRGVRAKARQNPRRLGQAPEFPEEVPPEKKAPRVVPARVAPKAKLVDRPVRAAVKADLGQPEILDDDDAADMDGTLYAVQAKAFREKDDAMIFLGYIKKELRRSKYKPFIMPVELPGKGKWYRVRIGKFPTRLEAEKFKSRFEKRLGLETFLVTL